MKHELARALLLISLSGGILSTALPSPALAAANPAPVLALRLDAAQQAARVTEAEPGIVIYTGQMSIDKLPVEYCVVTLNCSTDSGWASLISPTTAVFTNTTPQPFTCTVVVPQGTANNKSAQLVIMGRALAGGFLSLAETLGMISVEPYFRVGLHSKKPVVEISPGEQAFFTYWARNDGNAVDSFEREISNLKEIAARGWTVVLCACTLSKVQPGESKPDRITVASPRDEDLKGGFSINIVIKATSQNAKDFQQAVSGTLVLVVHVRPVTLPNLSPCLLILALSLAAGYLLRPRKI